MGLIDQAKTLIGDYDSLDAKRQVVNISVGQLQGDYSEEDYLWSLSVRRTADGTNTEIWYTRDKVVKEKILQLLKDYNDQLVEEQKDITQRIKELGHEREFVPDEDK